MTYPPPPGPPGADGWPGGDPNQQMPPQDPYGGFQQPSNPYGQQPPAGMPPQDPYNAPVTGMPGPDPYNAPASGVPGQDPYATNPYSAPPGGGFGPPMPAPQKSGNTGWIVGGVIGVVVILLAVVGVLFATGAFDSDSGDSPSASGGSSDAPSDGGDETDDGGGGGGDTPYGASSTGQYEPVTSLCDAIDLSGLEVYAPLTSSPTQSNSSSDGYAYTSCSGSIGDIGTDNYGSFDITATVYGSESDAQGMYDMYTDPSFMTGCDSSEEASGTWAAGTIFTAAGDNEDCYVGIEEANTGLWITDGTMYLDVSIGLSKSASDGAEGDILKDLAEQTLGACAA